MIILDILRQAGRHIESELRANKERARVEALATARRRKSRWQFRRRPPEADMPVPAIPPTGPLPLMGGAEAPLDFRES